MQDIEQGIAALGKTCPLMRRAFKEAGLPPLRRSANNYAALARTITGQLLSLASADAIWKRLEELVRPFEPQTLLALDDSALLAAGLSRAKVRALRALAQALQQGEIDLAGFERQSGEQIRNSLCKVHGIGPWTADIYVMFCLGDRDGFAAGDIALANALALLTGEDRRPTPRQLEKFARRWQPWRGVAARLLWHYYAMNKQVGTGL